jgi:hypothetical protein
MKEQKFANMGLLYPVKTNNIYNRMYTNLSIRFISCNPSPLRKRSLFAVHRSAEHKELNRFSMYSISSGLPGSCRL